MKYTVQQQLTAMKDIMVPNPDGYFSCNIKAFEETFMNNYNVVFPGIKKNVIKNIIRYALEKCMLRDNVSSFSVKLTKDEFYISNFEAFKKYIQSTRINYLRTVGPVDPNKPKRVRKEKIEQVIEDPNIIHKLFPVSFLDEKPNYISRRNDKYGIVDEKDTVIVDFTHDLQSLIKNIEDLNKIAKVNNLSNILNSLNSI